MKPTIDEIYADDIRQERARLEKIRRLYKRGDKTKLLLLLNHYIQNHEPIPEWLRHAFNDALGAAYSYKVKSWDDVFGRPLQKGKRLATERRNYEVRWGIVRRIRALHRAGEAIDKSLFDAVGAEFHIGGTTASGLYYKTLKDYADWFGYEYQEAHEAYW